MRDDRPLSILLSWLDWLSVKHWTVQYINWRLAPCVAILSALAVYSLPKSLNLFGEYGLVHQTNGLLQILAGFFIASLAAIATFQRQELDEIMGGDPPKLPKSQGHPFEELTRRRFLCLLFGYLAGASILLYLIGAGSMMAAALLHDWAKSAPFVHTAIRTFFALVYCLVLAHILITAVLGLYFLVDRMHRPKLVSGFVGRLPTQTGSVADEDKTEDDPLKKKK